MSQKTKRQLNKPSKKALVIAGVSLGLVAAIVLGILFLGSKQEPVGVYPFTMVGMDGYWGDSQESYGPVSTDKIQTVYLSDTQTVTEVLVSPGDPVKKGDMLMRFDTSLSDLQLERKRLEVEKLKLELDAAKAELKVIQAMKPMEPMPEFILPDMPVSLGATLTEEYRTYIIAGHDGKSMDTAFVCWIPENSSVDDALLEQLRMKVWKEDGLCTHGYPLAKCPICNCTHNTQAGQVCEYCNPCVHGVIEATCTICNPVICKDGNIEALCPICTPPICIHNVPLAGCQLCNNLCPHGAPAIYCKLCCEHGVPLGNCKICYCDHGVLKSENCLQCNPPAPASPEGQQISADGTRYRVQLLSNTGSAANSYYVIFKSTAGNTEMGPQTVWQGAHVQGTGKGFTLQYFTPFTSDYTIPEIEDTPIQLPSYDPGSGMTAAQIAQLRSDQEQKIKELTLKHKMADAEYKIMVKEMGDGHVYAEFDGNVVSVLSEQESRDQKQPVLKVSGGGGFFIAGSVSELEKDKLSIGQEVTVNDWSSGGVYTGTVKEIGDFPSLDGYWNGAGNPNTTYYPFTVFVGEEASLQSGNYANIQYSTSEAASGIYLEKAFIRTEAGKSYVYLRGADGNLEKHYVTTGKTLWGSYVEIKSGVTLEDYIAFPYGKDVKSGAPTKESDLSELYGY